MPATPDKSDQPLLELLRQTGGLSIQELTERLSVTATAVRQRLDRLCAGGLVDKEEIRGSNRGRPSHRYRASEAGLKTLDRAMVELAKIVWEEIQTIEDPAVRRYLQSRISRRLAEHYAGPSGLAKSTVPSFSSPAARASQPASENANTESATAVELRLQELARALREQQFPVNVERDPATMLPILKINGCPYPELSGESHDICEVEEAMFSELLGSPVKLRHCRCDSPDGGCVFDIGRESGDISRESGSGISAGLPSGDADGVHYDASRSAARQPASGNSAPTGQSGDHFGPSGSLEAVSPN